MPIIADYTIVRGEDGAINLDMTPPTAIGGWDVRFYCTKRFGGVSGLITKSVASGYNGASGITVTNSGQGQMRINLNSADTSGLDIGNYSYKVERLNSGFVSCLSQGYMLVR